VLKELQVMMVEMQAF